MERLPMRRFENIRVFAVPIPPFSRCQCAVTRPCCAMSLDIFCSAASSAGSFSGSVSLRSVCIVVCVSRSVLIIIMPTLGPNGRPIVFRLFILGILPTGKSVLSLSVPLCHVLIQPFPQNNLRTDVCNLVAFALS